MSIEAVKQLTLFDPQHPVVQRLVDLCCGRVPSHPNGIPDKAKPKKPRKRKDHAK